MMMMISSRIRMIVVVEMTTVEAPPTSCSLTFRAVSPAFTRSAPSIVSTVLFTRSSLTPICDMTLCTSGRESASRMAARSASLAATWPATADDNSPGATTCCCACAGGCCCSAAAIEDPRATNTIAGAIKRVSSLMVQARASTVPEYARDCRVPSWKRHERGISTERGKSYESNLCSIRRRGDVCDWSQRADQSDRVEDEDRSERRQGRQRDRLPRAQPRRRLYVDQQRGRAEIHARDEGRLVRASRPPRPDKGQGGR